MRSGLVGAFGVAGSADQIQRDRVVIVPSGERRASADKNLNAAVSTEAQLGANGPLRSSDVLDWLPCAVPSIALSRRR